MGLADEWKKDFGTDEGLGSQWKSEFEDTQVAPAPVRPAPVTPAQPDITPSGGLGAQWQQEIGGGGGIDRMHQGAPETPMGAIQEPSAHAPSVIPDDSAFKMIDDVWEGVKLFGGKALDVPEDIYNTFLQAGSWSPPEDLSNDTW